MYTTQDCLHYLLDSVGGGAQDGENRVLRQAIFSAYRDIINARDWRWHFTTAEVPLCGQNTIARHTLPWGVHSIDAFMLPITGVVAEYLEPVEWNRLVNSIFSTHARICWSVLPSTLVPDRYDLVIYNGWASDQCVSVSYRRRPRDLRFTGTETASRAGTISWDGNVVEGTGTSFSNLMTGSVIRVSSDPKKHPEPLTGMNSYSDEGLITTIANTGKLYAWSPAGKMTYPEGTKFVVSDYIDLAPTAYTALLSCAEMWMARLLGKNIEGASGIYGRDLRMAFEGDAVATFSGRSRVGNGVGGGGYGAYWFLYIRPGVDQGTECCTTGGPNANGVCCIPEGEVNGGSSDTVYDSCGNPI
jgi:hypothetical protein